jgi:phenylpropionate dioxygenase-like ring-hydroxylating dioxygenase large terminal subunit
MSSTETAALAAPHTSDTEMLTGFWYPALRSSQVRGRALRTTLLLEIPLVLGRDTRGLPFALRDSCPHRGMPLSCGLFDGETIECSYHGWRFDASSAQCREIPSLLPDSKLKVERIFATHFPCEEHDGYFWVYIPAEASREETPPPAPRLPVFSKRYRLVHVDCELPSDVDNGIIGLLDPAHGPYVHQSWWWRTKRSIRIKEKTYEPIPGGFRMRAHSPSANSAPYKLLRVYKQPITTTIDFLLPNMRLEQIRCGPHWFSNRVTITPMTRGRSRLDFCAAWNLFPWMPLVTPLFLFFARRFIRQDQRTAMQQAQGLQYNPRMMLIDDADRPARWYLQLKEACLDSRKTGLPMRHPLQEAVTLRWRT